MSYNGLTNQGLEYLTRCQVESKPVVFSKVKIGNGSIPMGSTGETTTDLYSFKKEIEILSKTQVENSIKMEILINNFDVLEEFYVKEIGVYVMDNDVEKLYWYINKDRPSPLPDKNTPAKHRYILHLETSQMESIILNYTGADLLIDKKYFDSQINKIQSNNDNKIKKILEVIENIETQEYKFLLPPQNKNINLPDNWLLSNRLQCFINGLLLAKEIDYTIQNKTIILKKTYKDPANVIIIDKIIPTLTVTRIDNLENNFSRIISTECIINNSTNFITVKQNYYASSEGWISNQGYTSYYFKTDENIEIWCDDNITNEYYSICLFDGEVTKSTYKGRWRKSENNLPTKNNKLKVPNNYTVVISILTKDNSFSLNTNMVLSTKLKDELNLTNTMKKDVLNIIAEQNSCYIQYVTGSLPQEAQEGLNIYLPTEKGYIKYEFLHINRTGYNADNWHIYQTYAVDENFSNQIQLTTLGEWECALFLKGRKDFVGGWGHGNEIVENLSILIDNKRVELTSLKNMTKAKEICIFETTTLYDNKDNYQKTTPIATHGKKYTFNLSNLLIEQSIEWKISDTAQESYLCMFPPLKTTTNKYYTNAEIVEADIPSNPNIEYNNVNKVVVYSDDIGFRATIETIKYPEFANNKFSLRDNNGGDYNKIYISAVSNSNPVTFKVGDRWSSKTKYKLEMR